MAKASTILIHNIDYLVTMTEKGTVRNTSLYIEGNTIQEIGTKKRKADVVIDAKGMVVLPGFINTHHHLFQAFLRHVPETQNVPIDQWIATVCSLAKKMDPEALYYAALTNMMELVASGCTTTTDMMYFFPREYDHAELFSSLVEAARIVGIRFHPYRGSMSLSQKDGALFADDVVESPDQIESHTIDMIHRFHDPDPDAMCKVGIAPCTVFTSSTHDYVQAASLAKTYGVNLQTHLSESRSEHDYVHSFFPGSPLQYVQSLGWVGPHVNFAHCIEITGDDRTSLLHSQSTVSHCPISNARSPLGQQGIAPIWELLAEGIPVSLGVDGSAGNDSSNILEEIRWARTLQGVRKESTYLSSLQALQMATIHGATALRSQQSLGAIREGMCADIAVFAPGKFISHCGAHDVVGSLVSCQSIPAEYVIINGSVRVANQQWMSIDREDIHQQARKIWSNVFTVSRKDMA